ncbi:hypothetical protein EVAR_70057_1 [Eumeta japonica]|uniref:Uncharacterized protein n=1 Tax=Eumeta variegata TaxID=151549 RepID=A0A4C1T5D3_EUMVA|nr:hypothetical protein EVAR_70057_1 [Eumeta japonica]
MVEISVRPYHQLKHILTRPHTDVTATRCTLLTPARRRCLSSVVRSRLGERISCGVVGKMMDSVFRPSGFFVTAKLHEWRSEYNCDGYTNPAAIHRWRIRLHRRVVL